MAKRTRREDRNVQAKRFASLRQRRAKHAAQFQALERRQRSEVARHQAARRRIATCGHPTTAVVEQRRHEYVDISRTIPSSAPPRAVLASVAVAFVLPLFLAIVAGLSTRQPLRTQISLVPRPHVGGRVSSHTRPLEASAAVRTLAQTSAHQLRRTPIEAPSAGRAAPKLAVHRSSSAVASAQARAVANRPSSAVSKALEGAQSATQIALAPQTAIAPQSTPQPYAPPLSSAPSEPHAPPKPHAPVIHRKPASPWSLSPDGAWTATIHAPSEMRDPSFDASTGQIIALEPSATDGRAANVTIGWSRAVTVTISSGGETRSVELPAPDDTSAAFLASARSVGPHLVNVGWTPLAEDQGVIDYKIYRTSGSDDPRLVAELPAAKHAWHDLRVAADAAYSYDVIADTQTGAVEANTQTVNTPDELASAPASVIGGKGMFLYFSSLAGDPRFFRHYDPETVIAEAHKTGIHVIELRMARGSCAMAQTPSAHAWLDRLIDAAARANISLVAWTVPRRATTQDLAQTVAAAAYRTPNGNGFVGLALDLETGDRYMGYGRKAVAGMVQYIKTVRAATGPRYLIVATVASPEMGNHTNADYPYARIAAYADVLQPMEYWHYFEETTHHEYARREVAGASAAAVARTRELAGRDIPVNVAGQSVALEGTGSPSGREIQWSLGGAKSAGGIGETFFDWAGTRPDAWAAIQAFDW